MKKWTINGALVFAFQGVAGMMTGMYATNEGLAAIVMFGGLGAGLGALLWHFLEQPKLPQQMTPQPQRDYSRNP